MNPISIMTIGMLGSALFRYRIDHDIEEIQEYYEEMMDLVQGAGYVGVDITSHETRILGVDYIKEQLAKRGLGVSSYIYFDMYAQKELLDTVVENGKKAADMALALGTDVLMLVPVSHEGIAAETPENIRKNLIAAFVPIAEYAVEKGLHPVVEDTPDLRMCFCKATEVLEVMDGAKGLELVYDSGNMILDGEDPVAYLKPFAGRIGFVHIKDMRILEKGTSNECMRDGRPTSSAPTGTGLIDIPAVIEELVKQGYERGITVEFAKHPDMSYLDSMIKSREYIESLIRKYKEQK